MEAPAEDDVPLAEARHDVVACRSKPRVACNPEGIPEELRKLPHWVAFEYTPPKKPGGKHGKVPIEPHTGRKASTTALATWGTFAQAMQRAEADGLGGVGFVFTDSGYAGVDLDHCRDPESGAIVDWASAIIESFATYTEVSPSGEGVHCIMRGTLAGSGRKQGNVEVYDKGRYFTMTGERVPGTPEMIADGQRTLDQLVASFSRKEAPLLDPVMKRPRGVAAADVAGTKPVIVPVEEHDEQLVEWFRTGEFKNLWAGDYAGFQSQSEADLRLCGLIARKVCNDTERVDRLFRRSGLMRAKWYERRGGQTYGEKTIAKARMPVARGNPEEGEPDSRVARALTDTGNAERLVQRYGKHLRYCPEWGKWLLFKDGRWQVDAVNEVMQTSKNVARGIYAEAAHATTDEDRDEILKWARGSEKAERRKAMVAMAAVETGIAIHVRQLDTHPNYLNCPNGTLDLTTFELRAHRQDDYLTKMCSAEYHANAACPAWLAFLERVLPDDDIRAFFQRFVGYGLTGEVEEQVMLLAVGDGQNGKSTFATLIQELLSQAYAIQIAAEVLIAKNQRNHPTEIADLFGVRMAFGTETGKGQELDEPLVKQLTGGDPLRARRMREDHWQFSPTHKLVLLTNHMPSIQGQDYAIWRRLLRVPFDVRIPKEERDPKLLKKLLQQRRGILAWAVEGCRQWRERGLDAPDCVILQPKVSISEPKPAERFVLQFVSRVPGERTSARGLYAAYRAWSRSHSWQAVSQTDFGTLLGHAGFGSKKTGGVVVYVDTRLGEGWGEEGPLPALIVQYPPRVEINGGSGPYCPQDSLGPIPDAAAAVSDERWEY